MELSTQSLKEHIDNLNILKKRYSNKVPVNYDIEKCVLGSILLSGDQNNWMVELDITYFADEKHAIAFFYIGELLKQNKALDFYTISNHVSAGHPTHSRHKIYFDTFASYFSSLMTESFSISNLTEYINILSQKSTLRKVLLASIEVSDMITKEDISEPNTTLQKANKTFVSAFEKVHNKSEIYQPQDKLPESFSQFLHDLDKKQDSFVSTGFSTLDILLGGLMPGGVYILAGRPSMGKTTFGMNIVESMLEHRPDRSCLVFSLEMSVGDLLTRSLCSIAKVSKAVLHQGDFMPQNIYEEVEDKYSKLRNYNLYFHEDDLNLIKLINISRYIKRRNSNLSLIVLDYVQLMASQSKTNSVSRQQEISDISRSVKLLAKELDLPVILISQLNRNVDDRPDRRPILSDLRESGALEQDADGVIFIYRDDVYNKDSVMPNKAEIIVSKNRHGPRGTLIADFKGSQYRFTQEKLINEQVV